MFTRAAKELTFRVEIWVAGHDWPQAWTRRSAAMKHMLETGAEEIGSGSGAFFYELWMTHSGCDPLNGEGACIADAEFDVTLSPAQADNLKSHGLTVASDLEAVLRCPIAVHVTPNEDETEVLPHPVCVALH